MNNKHSNEVDVFKQLTESITDIFFALDKNFNITYWNKTSEEITGIPARDVLGKNLFEFFPKVRNIITEEVFARVINSGVNEEFVTEYPFNDQSYTFSIYVYPIQEGITILAKDITDSFNSGKSEQLFRNIFDNMLEGCAIFDRSWNYLYLNNTHAKHALVDKDKALGKNFLELIPGVEKSNFFKAYKRTMDERIPQQVEDSFTFEDGSTHWYEARSIPVPEGIFLLSIEITERKKYEQELIRYQSVLTQAESMAHLGAWWIDINTIDDLNSNPLRWSEEVYRIFGYEPFSVTVTNDLFFHHVHPDDHNKVREQVARAISEKIPYSVEHRIITKDGSEKIVYEHAVLKMDKDGNLQCMMGAVQDITEFKNTLAMYQRLTSELNTIIESIPDALYIGTREGMTHVNKKGLELFGVDSLSEMKERISELSRRFNVRWPDTGIPLNEEELQFTKALNGETITEEVLATNVKTGQDIYLRVAAAPVIENGRVIAAVAVDSDITAMKKAQESIEASLNEKEVLLRELYHRTKNNMQVISSLLGLKAADVNDPLTTSILEDMKNRIQAIALVHQKLYQSQNLSRVNIREYITDLTDLLKSSYLVNPDQIDFRLELDEISVLIDTAVPCGLIINELISNSLKYAFPEGRKGAICIRFLRVEDDIIELEVSDNGIGITDDPKENLTSDLNSST
jgi:PAS domain S-box-containing protein